LVADAVLWRLDTPELADTLAGRVAADEHTAALSEAVMDDQRQLDELATAYADKAITMREWLTARKPIEARKQDAERRIARASTNSTLHVLRGTGSELAGRWAELDLGRQSAIVKAVLDHGVIAAGSRGARALDPARVQLVWRV
jgi:hypothetical protein